MTLEINMFTIATAILISLLGGGGLWLAHQHGIFHTITFNLVNVSKGKKFLVKGHRGEYRDAKQYFNELPESTKQMVGIFWDDPRIMGKRCRYSVGIVCAEEQEEESASEVELRKKDDGEWKDCEIDSNLEALYCSFPYTGSISTIIASIRVYPLWVEEAKKRGKGHGPIIRITTKEKGLIEFYFLTAPPPSSFAKAMERIK